MKMLCVRVEACRRIMEASHKDTIILCEYELEGAGLQKITIQREPGFCTVGEIVEVEIKAHAGT